MDGGVVHVYKGILLSHKKEIVVEIWLYLEIITLNEVSQKKTNTM